MGKTSSRRFTPAAGRFVPTRVYDVGLSLLTREAVWRGELVDLLAVRPEESILDVGCGTGSLAILLKRTVPSAVIVGLDPDPVALAIARKKSERSGTQVQWRQGFARDAASHGTFDKVVSSLVFHQVTLPEKRSGLSAMFAAAQPDGWVYVADYASQSHWLMRQLFRIVQALDGRTNTQPNADGFIEEELSRIAGHAVRSDCLINTPTGTISLFAVRNPA